MAIYGNNRLKNIITFLLIVGLSWLSITPLTAQDEKEAIKTVIAKETSAFMNVDYKTWAGTWVKAPYVYWSYSDSTTTSFVEGWDALNKTYAEYFRDSRPSHAEISNEWLEIRVYGNGAYAHFIQRVKDDIDTDETSQIRVLEKIDGKWMVVCVWAIAQNSKYN
jgi:hypothetical protein